MGTNATVFTGSNFVPSSPNTAHLSAFSSGAFRGVKAATAADTGAQLYNGTPVAPVATSSSSYAGTWPEIYNQRTVSWTVSDSTRISGYNVYYNRGDGYVISNSGLITGTSHVIGTITKDTDWYIYVQAVSPTGVTTNSSAIIARINTEAHAITLSTPAVTPSSITYRATFPADTYTKILFWFASDGTGTYVNVPNSSSTSVDFTKSGLPERSTYSITAQGQTKNGHLTTLTGSHSGTTSNAAPTKPATPSAVEITPAGGQPGTDGWFAVKRSMRITFSPAYDAIYQRTYVYYKRDDEANWTLALNTTSSATNQTVDVNDLTPRYENQNTTWQFFIRQFDTEGLSTDSDVGTVSISKPNPYSVAYWYNETSYTNEITDDDLGSDASGSAYSAINASDYDSSTYWRSAARTTVMNINSTDAPWYRGSIGVYADYIFVHSIRVRLPYASSSHGIRVACRWRDTGQFYDPGWNQYYISGGVSLWVGHFAIVNPSGTAWTTIPVNFSMDRGTSYGADGYKDFFFTVYDLDRDPPTATTGSRYAMLAEVQFTYDAKRRAYQTYYW